MSARKSLLKKIQEARVKSESEKKFSGTLMDYAELVEKDPSIVKTAHQRLYEAISEHGSYTMPDSDPRKFSVFDGESIKIHKYFEGEFFGMENVVEKVMSFLNSAAHRGEESRQVLLLMGPVGAGKSALTEHIKKAL
jgi:serine protein kinase